MIKLFDLQVRRVQTVFLTAAAGLLALEVSAQPGSLDTNFQATVAGRIYAVVLQDDGKIVIGGEFATVNGVARNTVARLNPDGTLDFGFDPGLGGDLAIHALALQGDGKILAGGAFTNFNQEPRVYLARLNRDGTVDASFNANLGYGGAGHSGVLALGWQSDNRILIGGAFATVQGQTRQGIARLNSDGTLDSSFNPGTGAEGGPFPAVTSLALQSDGRMVIGGQFEGFNGIGRTNLVRLNADGTVDTNFIASVDNQVFALLIQSDGRILMGGVFQKVNDTPRNGLARLNADGTLDNLFDPGTGTGAEGSFPFVRSIAAQADNKIVVGGGFSQFDGSTQRDGVARLLAEGSLDVTFAAQVHGRVEGIIDAVALQTDGKIVMGGLFTNVNGMARANLARLQGGTADSPGSVAATLDTWHLRNPARGTDLKQAAYGNGVFVAPGSFGTLLSSTNGEHWTARDSGTTVQLMAATHAEGSFVVTGEGGTMLTSTNGSDWTRRMSGTTELLEAIAHGNGRFVAVGYQGMIVTSEDGVEWIQRTAGTTAWLHSLVYAHNIFVAVGGEGSLLTSADGISWTKQNPANAGAVSINKVTFGDGTFVAVGGSGMILNSRDAVAWQRAEGAGTNNTWLTDVAYGNGRFVVIANHERILLSTNGQQWAEHPLPLTDPNAVPTAITYAQGVFVVTASNGSIFTSSDGVDWTGNVVPGVADVSDVSFANDRFIAVGPGAALLTSSDGRAWTRRELELAGTLHAVTHAQNMFVAAGDQGTIMTSSDGKDWIKRRAGRETLSGVTFADQTFIAVGRAGTILASTNGVAWAALESGTTNDLAAVAFGNDLWVVVGEAGTIITSLNGTNWVKRRSGTEIPLRDIVFAANRFVAVGAGRYEGSISLTSTDGITWSAHPGPVAWNADLTYGNGLLVTAGPMGLVGTISSSPDGTTWSSPYEAPGSLHAIVYGAGYFVAVGSGTILSSTNSQRWVDRSSASTPPLYAVAYGNGTFVAAGFNGVILQSDPLTNPAPRFLNPGQPLADGSFELHWMGGAGQLSLEASTDLAHWIELTNLVTNTEGSAWIDVQARDFPCRFYRIKSR